MLAKPYGTKRIEIEMTMQLNRRFNMIVAAVSLVIACTSAAHADKYDAAIKFALEKAGDNATEIKAAIETISESRSEGMRFLIANMPARDLKSLSKDFLLDNVNAAYDAFEKAPWRDEVPHEVFLNNVLPHVSINERRDAWRKDFNKRFQPMIAELKTPGEVAAALNNKIFPELKVKYSRKRRRADQGPFESIDSGLASCTGLSILLIDACRSVGVPARFVGTPLWADRSGNHSWVEVWDDGWHFTGAAEPNGDDLDKAWFTGRASTAKRDDPKHAIYAVSYRKTPTLFPLVWDRSIDYVHAVNVTDRYANAVTKLAEGLKLGMFRTLDANGDRCSVKVRVADAAGKTVFEGETNDERFDGNDHISTPLKRDETYTVELAAGDTKREIKVNDDESDRQLFTLYVDEEKSVAVKEARKKFPAALTKQQATEATSMLLEAHKKRLATERAAEMEARSIKMGEREMPFFYKVYGEKPEGGRSLFISMHGGGGAPKRVNDRQWENQKKLYKPTEGVYVAPRAPTNTWNLWHEEHIDGMFARLIENMIVMEDVNPNRVYLMGYSAGGDGVYQLGPRMADRWAAASMMAGHPNGVSPLSLRNTSFAIYMGGKDAAYKRNKKAAEWKQKLADLQSADPQGYHHLVTIYPDKGHWMDGEDASSLVWMQKCTRSPFPDTVVWKQGGVTHSRFYWLKVDDSDRQAACEIRATLNGQVVTLETKNADDVKHVSLRFNDEMLDLDKPIVVKHGDETLFDGKLDRSIDVIETSLAERYDPKSVFSAQKKVKLE